MYTQFAAVYDHLMADIDYPGWAKYLLELLRRAGVEPRTACECACGTGLLSVELARLGLKLTAGDLSGDMLELASARARRAGLTIPFIAQDMRSLALHRPVDAIFCACDGVNYLLTDADTLAFFRAAHANLRPGGALVFDVSSEHKLRSLCDQRQFFEDLDALTYLWTNTWDAEKHAVEMELSCFVQAKDGRYDRFDERQVQRAHSVESLNRLLARTGFTGIRAYADQSFDPPAPDEARIHIAAIKGH